MSDRRIRRQLALGAVRLFLLITASLSSGAVARAQDETEPPAPETPAPAPPALTLTTEADKTTFSAVGEVITYTYTLTNTGGVALDDLSVFDVSLGDVDCPLGPLGPRGTVFCEGLYFTTKDDLDARVVTDRSQGFGTYGGSEEVASNEYTLIITYLAPHAGMALEMEADGPTLSPSGEIITVTYDLTNTGDVALDDLSVTDTWVEDVFCGSVHVEPGGSVTCVGSKFITQDDRDNGEVTATAQGRGTYLFGSEEVRSNAASLRIPVATAPPALTLKMNADRATFSRVDEAITVTFELTNTGGVALNVGNVFDDKLGDGFCDTPAPLEPGGSFLCTGIYSITQADLDAGSVTSGAFGIATYGENEKGVTSNDASWTVDAGAAEPPALTLTMGADVATFSAVGDEIELSYRLTNTGGVDLDSVSVSDSKVGAVVCTLGPLGPDGSKECTASYFTTQDDLDAGKLSNVAVGTGTYGGSEYVASDPASPDVTYREPKPPALTLKMDFDASSFSRVDEVIAFTYTLTNTGGVTLDVSVSHPGVKDVYCPSETLEPGGSVDCTGSYRTTQADLERGYLDSVVGLGTYGESETVASDAVSPNVTYSAPEPPALTLEPIEADRSTFSAVGETITYFYELTNTGGVALDELSVTGTVNGIDVGDADCESGPLEPNESIECEGDYTITEANLGTGSVTIFATGHGKTGEGEEVASDVADLTIPAIAP